MYFVFTRMPGESYRGRLRSLLLCLCDVFRELISSSVCWNLFKIATRIKSKNSIRIRVYVVEHSYFREHEIIHSRFGGILCCKIRELKKFLTTTTTTAKLTYRF